MIDLTYEQAKAMGQRLLDQDMGVHVYFKFTCAHCGERVTFQEEYKIYRKGECAKCGETTDPITGYGLLVAFQNVTVDEALDRLIDAKEDRFDA